MVIVGGEKVSPMQAQRGGLHKYVGPMPTRPITLWEVGSIGGAYKKICGGWVGVYLGKVSPMPSAPSFQLTCGSHVLVRKRAYKPDTYENFS